MRGSGFGSDAARGVGGERWAGESSRGTAKTPPLQSALRSALRQMPPIAIVSMRIPCHAGRRAFFCHDAARHVVVKTIGSQVEGMWGGHGMRIRWRWGAHAHMGEGRL